MSLQMQGDNYTSAFTSVGEVKLILTYLIHLHARAADLKFERAEKHSEMVQEYERTDAGEKTTSVGKWNYWFLPNSFVRTGRWFEVRKGRKTVWNGARIKAYKCRAKKYFRERGKTDSCQIHLYACAADLKVERAKTFWNGARIWAYRCRTKKYFCGESKTDTCQIHLYAHAADLKSERAEKYSKMVLESGSSGALIYFGNSRAIVIESNRKSFIKHVSPSFSVLISFLVIKVPA